MNWFKHKRDGQGQSRAQCVLRLKRARHIRLRVSVPEESQEQPKVEPRLGHV